MARKKISEFVAKTLLYKNLDIPYSGMSYDSQKGAFSDHAQSLDASKKYVVKVDQGVKKRFKNGLVKLNIAVPEITDAIKTLEEKGYSQFIIEEFVAYDSTNEKYLAVERIREGLRIYYSDKGGVDIEENAGSVKTLTLTLSPKGRGDSFPLSPLPLVGEGHGRELSRTGRDEGKQVVTEVLGLNPEILEKILQAFESYYFSFLEINPLIILNSKPLILDLAVEVDDTAEFFVDNAWTSKDFVEHTALQKTSQEKAIQELADKSQAAFSYTMLNPNGSIWMLLSGGGASIVLADEVANIGLGKQLANYGEYSGNPNGEETYIYTKNVLELMLFSTAPKKVLIIGGGVANFTDIRITFKGVIQALDEHKVQLKEQGVKVYVRRGGPKQAEGLSMMTEFLQKNDLYGFVSGPDLVLTDIVAKAIEQIKQ